MAQSGYTPIGLYYSNVSGHIPVAGRLVNGELAINIADGNVFYKNASGVVTQLAGLSGYSGISGYSGFSGISGYSGFSGISGYSGSGISGYSGSGVSGYSGFSGYSGISGYSGPPGVILSNDNTWTGTQSFVGTSAKLAEILTNAAEVATITATPASATVNYYTGTQCVLYSTANATGSFTLNIAHSVGTALNTVLATGQALTLVYLVTQGPSGGSYYASSIQVDGTTSGVTTVWQGGTPTTGNASGIDSYTFSVIKTANATFTVLASVVQFKV
jgi:hypothetical protein